MNLFVAIQSSLQCGGTLTLQGSSTSASASTQLKTYSCGFVGVISVLLVMEAGSDCCELYSKTSKFDFNGHLCHSAFSIDSWPSRYAMPIQCKSQKKN